MWRRYCCCCCAAGPIESRTTPSGSVTEEDYLLPGSEWDPSVSSASSGRVTRQWRTPRKDSGNYVPPSVPPSTTLPTFEEFGLLKTVGKGAFGKVMLCVHTQTRILYALKVVPKAKIVTQKQINQILAESTILRQIRHPFCVLLQYAFQNDDFLFYVFEYAAGGMLFYHLRQEGRFHEHRARFYFGEILLALEYLHGFGIIFRDLKPENCMLSDQGHIVLTDFGSAKMLDVMEKTRSIAGTPQYLAPEVLRGEPYSFSADWWSSGILLYEMLVGKIPFYSADRLELYKMVLRGEFKVPSYVSPRARALLYRLINQDPDFRIGCSSGGCHKQSAAEIKEHPFFSQAPMDPDEEAQYAAEEAERERHQEALAKTRRRVGTFIETAGSVMRTLSINTSKRLSGQRPPFQGTMCQWTWEELERREVNPSFRPRLTHATDVRHFDPIMTAIPASVVDLVTTDRSLHLEGFDFVASASTHNEGEESGTGTDEQAPNGGATGASN